MRRRGDTFYRADLESNSASFLGASRRTAIASGTSPEELLSSSRSLLMWSRADENFHKRQRFIAVRRCSGGSRSNLDDNRGQMRQSKPDRLPTRCSCRAWPVPFRSYESDEFFPRSVLATCTWQALALETLLNHSLLGISVSKQACWTCVRRMQAFQIPINSRLHAQGPASSFFHTFIMSIAVRKPGSLSTMPSRLALQIR